MLGAGEGAAVWRWKVLSLTLPIDKEALGHCPACPGPSLKAPRLHGERLFVLKLLQPPGPHAWQGPRRDAVSWPPALPYGDVSVPQPRDSR